MWFSNGGGPLPSLPSSSSAVPDGLATLTDLLRDTFAGDVPAASSPAPSSAASRPRPSTRPAALLRGHGASLLIDTTESFVLPAAAAHDDLFGQELLTPVFPPLPPVPSPPATATASAPVTPPLPRSMGPLLPTTAAEIVVPSSPLAGQIDSEVYHGDSDDSGQFGASDQVSVTIDATSDGRLLPLASAADEPSQGMNATTMDVDPPAPVRPVVESPRAPS